MKIAIDISPVIYGTGVSKYTSNLVKSLLKIDSKNEYILFGYSLRRLDELKSFCNNLEGNFKTKLFRFPPLFADIIFNRLNLMNIETLVGQVHIFHSSDWVQPKSRCRTVTTVHDLVPLIYPNYSDSKIISTHKARFKRVKKHVDAIIAPSGSTKSDLLQLGVESRKISVIPEASISEFSALSEKKINSILKKYGIGNRFVLAVGVNERKNTKRIIKAFESVEGKLKLDNLVVVGENKVGLKAGKNTLFTGFISDNDLSALYSKALVLVYPSIYEGFGLPILDAFSKKTPVVTSNTGSMKEVASDAAVLVNPLSVKEIASGIEKAIKNTKQLSKKGIVRASHFSWEKTAKLTLSLYNSLF